METNSISRFASRMEQLPPYLFGMINKMKMEKRRNGDDVIDLGTLVLLTERTLWRAIGHLDLPLVNWTARKEYGAGANQDPVVHVYIEGEDVDPDELSPALHAALIECDEDYASFNAIMARNPIVVTRLATGTFQRYLEEKEAEEADLGQLKPPRMQPSEENLARLLKISAMLGRSG